ncbi:hypothetical protein JL721_9832 [Aureococcus anophagefferens]|nr:hypothetical protein JL721_9832 [Aureococcus anophagefferens]
MMADAASPRRVVADVDALDAADDETGPAATIAALKSLQRQIGRLDRDRYGALSRAALLRQEIGELEQSLEQLAGAARAERTHVDAARAQAQARRDAAVAAAAARRARADERLAALEAKARRRAREAARRTRGSRATSRLVKERALRDSLHEALEEMIAVNKRLAAKPRYARRTAASRRRRRSGRPSSPSSGAAPSRRRARPGPAA